jgi:hypothetical protein
MSDETLERLRELAARIERVALEPAELAERRPWLRVARPLYRLFRWRPTIRTKALRELLGALREAEKAAPDRARLGQACSAAIVELAENVAMAERASVVDGAAAHGPLAGWLTRLHEITARAARAAADPGDTTKRDVALALDAEWALAPLALRDRGSADARGVQASKAGRAGAAGRVGESAHAGAAGRAGESAHAGAAGRAGESAHVGAAGRAGEGAHAGAAGRAGEGAHAGAAGRAEEAGDAGAAGRAEEAGDAGSGGGAGAASDVASAASQAPEAAEEDAASAAPPTGASGDALDEADPRLVELELAAIDRVLDAARAETHFLGRRRRLFEAARKLLLDASAALPLDVAAVNARAQHIADEIVLANRWEAAGVSRDVALPYQAITAASRNERQRLYATLRASFALACGEGNLAVASRAREALGRLESGGAGGRDASTVRSAAEILGDASVGAVREAYAAARSDLAFRKLAPPGADEDADEREQRMELWGRYLDDSAVLATLSAAISVDGCFEVGGTLAPVRVEEEVQRVRVVSYPTQDLTLTTARDAADLPGALIDDPRGVILALAEGRLLTRKFRRVDTVREPRTRLTSEVRIYVLDGSDSMFVGPSGRRAGARARMRDAILLAELATLYRRATERGRTTRVVLFYRYFTKLLGDVTRVETAADALRAMTDVVRTPRHGGTDIEAALLASFDQIRSARAEDPELSRAQIVLVTDGAAPVDEAAVTAAREREGSIRIGVSVIALGEENEVLRRLVARQRARGEPAFYHYLSDADLAELVDGRRAAGMALHAIAPDPGGETAARAEDLAAEVGALVDEIEALDRARDRRSAAPAQGEMGSADAEALAALGLPRLETEGERARREARERDERSLARRFDVWFPAESNLAGERPDGDDRDGGAEWAADVEATLVVLATLSDVLADLGGSPAERRADAIELLERLLPDARLSPGRYLAVARARPAPIRRALAFVRAAAAGMARPATPRGR